LISTYSQKVLSIASANLIAYWPMNETSGTTADNLGSIGSAGDGTFARDVSTMTTGAGPAGGTAPLFDGTNDYCDIYSASLNSALNWQEVTIMAWAKVSGAGVWTDGANGRILRVAVDANNVIYKTKDSGNNSASILYKAGGTTKFVIGSSFSPTTWVCYQLTNSVSGDALKYYRGGAQVGSTQTGLGTWTGALNSALCLIGAASQTPSEAYDGYIAHVAIWDTILNGTQLTNISTV
jgi:hypothetical protein